MKKQLFLMTLATASLLVSCSKDQLPEDGGTRLDGQITVKATGAGSIGIDTRKPVTGTSLHGLTADIYTAAEDLNAKTGDLSATFTSVYARGSMTFDDNSYVGYNPQNFGGTGGGNVMLPTNGTTLYMYGFYPQDWKRITLNNGSNYEALSYVYDGKTDLMATWLKPADNCKLKLNDATLPDKADLTFKHLLTRYNICVKAVDASSAALWGRVKSVKMKETEMVNRVCFAKEGGADMSYRYDKDATNVTTAAFYQLGGTTGAPVYQDTKFGAADYAGSIELTTNATNACYTMGIPVTVDDSALTPELTFEVVTITNDGKEKTTEVPVSLKQEWLTLEDGVYSTRGYSVNLSLNFRAGFIQALAEVVLWKEFGKTIDVGGLSPVEAPKIGELKDGGIVYQATDVKNYMVVSFVETPSQQWSLKGDKIGITSETDGKANTLAVKAYSDSKGYTFNTDYAVVAACYNYTGKDGKDAPGTWYLPAKNELTALYTEYGKPDQVLKDAFTALGATPLGTNYVHTSTEDASGSIYAYSGSGGGFYMNGKAGMSYPSRCIKRVASEVVTVDLSENGTANCYLVTRTNAGGYSFDATVRGNNAIDVAGISYGTLPNLATATEARVIWQTGGTNAVIKTVKLSDDKQKVEFTLGTATEGNAVIGLFGSSAATAECLWSWHIWRVNGALPADVDCVKDPGLTGVMTDFKMMGLNLGAYNNATGDVKSIGLMYQWGRKDPFPGPGVFGNTEPTNIYGSVTDGSGVTPFSGAYTLPTVGISSTVGTEAWAVKYPGMFIINTVAPADWLFTKNDDLWGNPWVDGSLNDYNGSLGKKSIYDPCPVGYRIPPDDTFCSARLESFANGSEMIKIVTSGSFWFPAAGKRFYSINGQLTPSSEGGYYWMSSRAKTVPAQANAFYFYSGRPFGQMETPRGDACSVRCVLESSLK